MKRPRSGLLHNLPYFRRSTAQVKILSPVRQPEQVQLTTTLGGSLVISFARRLASFCSKSKSLACDRFHRRPVVMSPSSSSARKTQSLTRATNGHPSGGLAPEMPHHQQLDPWPVEHLEQLRIEGSDPKSSPRESEPPKLPKNFYSHRIPVDREPLTPASSSRVFEESST